MEKGGPRTVFPQHALLAVSHGMAGRKALQHPGTICQRCHHLVLSGPEHGWPLIDPCQEHAHDLAF